MIPGTNYVEEIFEFSDILYGIHPLPLKALPLMALPKGHVPLMAQWLGLPPPIAMGPCHGLDHVI